MSKSYKKYPKVRVYYGKSGKWARTHANRRIRRLPLDYDIPNGRSFKKITESWDIWDYSFTEFKEWMITDWEKDQAEIANGVRTWKAQYNTTLEEAINEWKRRYIRK